MEKSRLDRRLAQMQAEGTRFRAGVEIGEDITGATCARATTRSSSRPAPPCRATCRFPGATSSACIRHGLPAAGQPGRPRRRASTGQITAEGKHVIVIGGGDTGADCIGTAHRQGARSVTNLAIGRSRRPSAPSTSRGRPTR